MSGVVNIISSSPHTNTGCNDGNRSSSVLLVLRYASSNPFNGVSAAFCNAIQEPGEDDAICNRITTILNDPRR